MNQIPKFIHLASLRLCFMMRLMSHGGGRGWQKLMTEEPASLRLALAVRPFDRALTLWTHCQRSMRGSLSICSGDGQGRLTNAAAPWCLGATMNKSSWRVCTAKYCRLSKHVVLADMLTAWRYSSGLEGGSQWGCPCCWSRRPMRMQAAPT